MSESNNLRPIALTPGEPAGIGPDLVVQLAQEEHGFPLVAVADTEMLHARAEFMGLPLKLLPWNGDPLANSKAGELYVSQVDLQKPAVLAQLDPANAGYVLTCLDKAIDGAMNGHFSAVVTGPVHKGVINEAGIAFSGHTEHFQKRCGVKKVVMMLTSPKMRVALVTTHLPLKDVSQAITQENLREVLNILVHDLQRDFGLAHPKILVAGLNPHAGEGGHMGREEIDVIVPVLEEFAHLPAELSGPLPADTLFTPKYLNDADAVLAMYHDQGLPVLKYEGFGSAVNITLGLPIIRTSVDHGTALDLAGSGTADLGSMRCAIDEAERMARNRASISHA